MSNNSTGSSGIGFTGLLCIAFIVLKLMHIIDWSWWWVLAPLWSMVAIILLVLLIYTIRYIIRYKI
jgi:phosphoglycerol transferase MdoB-like AlkP superfamily enzyme